MKLTSTPASSTTFPCFFGDRALQRLGISSTFAAIARKTLARSAAGLRNPLSCAFSAAAMAPQRQPGYCRERCRGASPCRAAIIDPIFRA